jgi:hypothetical protein
MRPEHRDHRQTCAVSGNAEFHCTSFVPSQVRKAALENIDVPIWPPRRAPDEQTFDVRPDDQIGAVVGIDAAAVKAGRFYAKTPGGNQIDLFGGHRRRPDQRT